jgi:TRAP-type mannitol/chloroaromatic compound transport system permease small subunit
VRVDIIYQRLGFKGRAWVNFFGVLLFLIPGCFMVVTTSWKFVANSFAILEGSPDPGGIPLRFLIKGCIPVGFSLLLLQGLSLGIHSLMQMLGIEQAKEEKA